jgi:hypothetical protein
MTQVQLALATILLVSSHAVACELNPNTDWHTMNGDEWGFGPGGFVKPGDCAEPPYGYQQPSYMRPQDYNAPRPPDYGAPMPTISSPDYIEPPDIRQPSPGYMPPSYLQPPPD